MVVSTEMVSTVGGWKPPLLGLRRIPSSAELWNLLRWRGFQSAFVEMGLPRENLANCRAPEVAHASLPDKPFIEGQLFPPYRKKKARWLILSRCHGCHLYPLQHIGIPTGYIPFSGGWKPPLLGLRHFPKSRLEAKTRSKRRRRRSKSNNGGVLTSPALVSFRLASCPNRSLHRRRPRCRRRPVCDHPF